ncbi:hypothetical protein ABDB91_14990 [Desulfoscipio sp. XC116]|uniref:hypothetical protein n=1 Tax=Desulfoscipio sp. XC116 TaxID=3144975 RepID=UPI00325B8B4E
MQVKVLLLYGSVLPPFKHIDRIIRKYYKYYLNDKRKGDFIEDNYYEIWVEERYTGLSYRKNRNYITVVPVKQEYFSKFMAIFKELNGNVCLCKQNHEHLHVTMAGVDYEGYCFYLDNNEEKIIFLDEYCENEEKWFSVNQLDAYAQIPLDKRWICVKADEDTEVAFKEWVADVLKSV